jgi:2-phospho-L-lactate transferase/gluconeogenesis factor (CofD/UPF0052 family)
VIHPSTADLKAIGVNPSAQGGGVGSIVVPKIEQALKRQSVEKIEIYDAESLYGGKGSFWERQGYETDSDAQSKAKGEGGYTDRYKSKVLVNERLPKEEQERRAEQVSISQELLDSERQERLLKKGKKSE